MMAELLESPDLFMMQVEMDAYTLAKKVFNICTLFVLKVIIMLCIIFLPVVVPETTPIMGG